MKYPDYLLTGRYKIFIIPFLLLLAAYSSMSMAAYVYWSPSNPMPDAVRFEGVVWDGVRYVAVGKNGVVATSPDGSQWDVQDAGSITHLFDIAWNGVSTYVAVGKNGIILTSTDAQNWSVNNLVTDKNLWGITWDGSRFYAYGEAEDLTTATLLSSPDGTNWTRIAVNSFGKPIKDLASDGTTLIAVGGGSYPVGDNAKKGEGITLISTDSGNSWTRHKLSVDNFSFAGGIKPATLMFNAVELDPGGSNNFVITGEHGIVIRGATGTNPSAWPYNFTTNEAQITDAYWQTTVELIIIDKDGNAHVSNDGGASWAAPLNDTGQALESVTYNGSDYLAVGSGISVSIDPGTSSYTENRSSLISQLQAVTSDYNVITDTGGSRLVAAGYEVDVDLITPTTGSILTNFHDGNGWRAATISPSPAPLYSMYWDGSRFIAGGADATILTSTDAVTWTQATTPGGTAIIRDATFDGTNHFAVGDGGTILKSDNGGANWSAVTSSTTEQLNAVTADDAGNIVAVGNNGVIIKSTDGGTNWSPVSTILPDPPPHLNNSFWHDGLFIITGDSALILTSSNDGSNWQSRVSTAAAGTALHGISRGNNQYIVTGSNNVVLKSPDGLSWSSMLRDTTDRSWFRSNGSTYTFSSVTWNGQHFTATGQDGFIIDSNGADLFLTINDVVNDPSGKVADYDYVRYDITLGNRSDFHVLPGGSYSLDVTFPPQMEYRFASANLSPGCTPPPGSGNNTLSCVIFAPFNAGDQFYVSATAEVVSDIPSGTLDYLTTSALLSGSILEANHANNLSSATSIQWSLTDKFIAEEDKRVAASGAGSAGGALLLMLFAWLSGPGLIRARRMHA